MRRTLVLLLFGLASALLPLPAGAVIQTGHFASDTEMLAILSDSLFVAEGRIGDRGGAATFELDLGQSTAAPAVQAQYPWQSGRAEPFSLGYDAGTHLATFVLGGHTLTYVSDYQDFGVIYVRTRAIDAGASVSVGDLALDGGPLGDGAAAAGADGLDILWITGQNFGTGFTLTGVATLGWGAIVPSQSRLAFQIKVARLNVVAAGADSWSDVKRLYR